MNLFDTGWVVGILEGEGSFTQKMPTHYPIVSMGITDQDIAERLASLIGARVYGPYISKLGHKSTFQVVLQGKEAATVMKLVSPHMGQRRQARIKEILNCQSP